MIVGNRKKVKKYLDGEIVLNQTFFNSTDFQTMISDKHTEVYRSSTKIDIDGYERGYLHVAFGRTEEKRGIHHIGYKISEEKVEPPDGFR